MNQSQRKYLVDKIEASVKARIEAIRSSEPEPPDMCNYLFHAVMNGTLKCKSAESLEALFKQRALRSKSGKNWLTTKHAWGNADNMVNLDFDEIFIIPDEYLALQKDYEEKMQKSREERYKLRQEADGLITRITLASDKTLQQMINEVDDMGNISLMDTKIKSLTGGAVFEGGKIGEGIKPELGDGGLKVKEE